MSAATLPRTKPVTTEELLAMPEDGIHRELIRGRIVEVDMTVRNRFHSMIEAQVTGNLWGWLKQQPKPRAHIAVGEAGFIFESDPDTTVGIDVALVSPEMAAASPENTSLFRGAPILAVEILSPSDTQASIAAMIREYLAAGVKVLWVLDPDLRTVDVYRPGQPPIRVNETETLDGGVELPGFTCPAGDFFD